MVNPLWHSRVGGSNIPNRYGKAQQQLLGEAITLIPREPDKIQKEIFGILGDPNRYRKMSEEGRRRMGKPGASRRIAEAIMIDQTLRATIDIEGGGV